jgi:CheY-like chemotaxis protein
MFGGAELAGHLRQEFPKEELVLVAVTGLGKAQAVGQGENFDKHLLKPVSPQGLVELLNDSGTAFD